MEADPVLELAKSIVKGVEEGRIKKFMIVSLVSTGRPDGGLDIMADDTKNMPLIELLGLASFLQIVTALNTQKLLTMLPPPPKPKSPFAIV